MPLTRPCPFLAHLHEGDVLLKAGEGTTWQLLRRRYGRPLAQSHLTQDLHGSNLAPANHSAAKWCPGASSPGLSAAQILQPSNSQGGPLKKP
jgi:hypothetical protein